MAEAWWQSDDSGSSDDESILSGASSSCTDSQSSTVYVGKFPPSINESHLRNHFSGLGQAAIKKITVVRDRQTKVSKGFSFVQFCSDDVAERAITVYNRSKLLDKHMISVRKKSEKKAAGHGHSRARGRRKPSGGSDSVKVWVGNVSANTTKNDLITHFGAFKKQMVCPIQDIGIGKNATHFTFLTFSSLEDANDVVTRMNGTSLNGKKLRIQLSQPKQARETPPTTPISPPTTPISPPATPISPIDSPIFKEVKRSGPDEQPVSVVITNIDSQIGKGELEDLLAQYSPVSIEVSDNHGETKIASVRFSNHGVASEAVKDLNGKNFLGKSISASMEESSHVSSRICVSGLSPMASDFDVFNSVKRFGKVKGRVSIINAQPRYACVTFFSVESAQRAVKALNGSVLKGSQISVWFDLQQRPVHLTQQTEQRSRMTDSKQMSQELYELCCRNSSEDLTVFKKKGGTIAYSDGYLTLEACSQEDLEQLLKVLMSYTDRTLECSPHQWNQLVVVNEFGIRKMDQLKDLFSSHPNLVIEERPPLRIVFSGTLAAVDSAYYHFYMELNKELTVDTSKVEALLELMPDLCDNILKKYRVRVNGFTVGSRQLNFEGVSAQVALARKEVETTLASVKEAVLPDLPPPLMNAGITVSRKEGLTFTILTRVDKPVLFSCSDAHLQQALKIFNRKPYINTVTLENTDSSLTPASLQDNISSDSVHVILNENTVTLQGFDKDEVQSARKEIQASVTSCIKQEMLVCSLEQKAYLKNKLKSSSGVNASFPNLVLLRGNLYVKGTQEERKQCSRSLLAMVPRHFTTVVMSCDRRAFPLIEQYVLKPNGLECIVDSEKKAATSKGSAKELRLMLYSQTSVEEPCSQLKRLSPCTVRVPVNPKAKGLVEAIKNNVESKFRCKVVVPNQPHVLIHCLRSHDGQKAKHLITDHIRSNLVVFRCLPSPPLPVLHMKFLTEIHKERFDECSKGLELFHLPKKQPFHVIEDGDTEVIKVKGTVMQVDAIKEMLDELIGENEFCQHTFSLSGDFPPYLFKMWHKRWNNLKATFQNEYQVLFEYKSPVTGEHSDLPAQKFEVQFCVYGFNVFAFELLKAQLRQEVSQPLQKLEIPLPSDRVKQVFSAIRENKLDFRDYVVNVFCNDKGGKVVLKSPQCSQDDLQVVHEEIVSFLQHTKVSTADLAFPDVPTYLLFTSKEQPFYQKALVSAKSLKVFLHPYRHSNDIVGVTLRGSAANLEKFSTSLQDLLGAIQSLLGHVTVPIDPLALPCLTASFCKDLNSKLEHSYMAVLSKHTVSTASSSTQSTVWYWENDKKAFTAYRPDISLDLNASYRMNPVGTHTINLGIDKLYCVDFAEMVQINKSTGLKRKVTFSSTGANTIQWYWMDRNNQPKPYTAQQSSAIEGQYKVKSPVFCMTIGQNLYDFDLDAMIQVNPCTGNVRRIKRQACPSKQQPSVVIHGFQKHLDAAASLVQTKLSQSLKTREIVHPLIGHEQFYEEVQEIAKKHGVSCETKPVSSEPKSKRSLLFRGVSFCVNKIIQEVQERIIEAQTPSSDGDIPPEWDKQDNDLQLFVVARGSQEYERIDQLFKTSIPSSKIVSITRIQNQWLYERYVQHKKRLASKNGGITNERELFHGTSDTDPKEIYDSEEGFDMRFSASGMWGRANYFAVKASYSHSYAHKNVQGFREMFLAKVLTGECYTSQPNSSLRMPPKKPAQSGYTQMRYDTVTGNTGGSQVFMTYDNQKAYPAYLIRYY